MNNFSRILVGALLAALLLWPAAFAAADNDDDEHGGPNAKTLAPTAVADLSATLAGTVKENGSSVSFRFEYGATTSYGQSTPEATLPRASPTRPVSAAIDNLAPGTVYHVRIRAWNNHGTSVGSDQSFTTTASGAPPAAANPAVSAGTAPAASGAAPKPVLGGSVVVAPLMGAVKFKQPGSAVYTTLTAGGSVPVGSLVDTRRGAVVLTSALGGGTTQSAALRGALFQVRQASTGSGVTDIVLRGGSLHSCPRGSGPGVRAAAAAPRKAPKRRLWAADKGGLYRTHGLNSVATVRGTSWVTTDTCAGTRTRVTAGSVSVRDRRSGKTVLVRAGESYLARSAR